MTAAPTLTERQEAAVARWWAAQDRRAIAAAWRAAGFTVVYSCIGWCELQRTMPDVAAAIGRSVIARFRLRA